MNDYERGVSDERNRILKGLPPSNENEHYKDNRTEAEHGWDNCRQQVLALLEGRCRCGLALGHDFDHREGEKSSGVRDGQ